MTILIKGGKVINPATGMEEVADVLVENGVVSKIAKGIKDKAEKQINAKGCFVMPGFIDLHVHLREPGFEYKETIRTGAMAAARGGVTTICPMPNTRPVIDSPDRVKDLLERAKDAAVHILPIGAVTIGQEGNELADIAGMKEAGAVALSEDGKSVMDSLVFRHALKEAAKNKIPMFSHCEDKALVDGGVMNAGAKAEELGLPGITNAVEDVIVARDILMAKETGCRLHLCHCSTADSVLLIEMAKQQGLPVTGEVCPHHFILTSDDIKCDDPNYKMNPPLRTKKDVDALIRGLKDGSFKVISTDHAPHAVPEKTGSIRNAAFGIVGIETSFALSYTALVETGILTISQLIEKMSWNPAQILGSDRGTLQKGHPADIVIADIDHEYKIDKNEFASKGRNTPFDGWKVKGKILYTICDGKVVYQNA